MQTSPLAQFVDTDRIAKLSHRDLLLMRLYRPTPRMYGLGKYFPGICLVLEISPFLPPPPYLYQSSPNPVMMRPDPAGDVAKSLASMTLLGDFHFKESHSFLVCLGGAFERITVSSYPLDREIVPCPSFPLLRLSPLCGKSAYILFVFFDEHLFPSFQFVGYKQSSPAPSHARDRSRSHSQITLPIFGLS